MLTPGLVSISFRSLHPEEIISLTLKAGLQSIEWGGDIHVCPGDTKRAREVGLLTRSAGLKIAAYGSYYRLGSGMQSAEPFEKVLASAVELGAPTIRVWAGAKGSADCSRKERDHIVRDASRVAQLAGQEGLTVCLEYHDGTLMDSRASVRSLLKELDHPNIEFLWQPSHGETVEECAGRLLDVLPRLRNVHVFHWWPNSATRLPLSEGEARWRTYLDILRESAKPIGLLLEFVANDSPSQLTEDASSLKRLIEQ